MLGRSGWAGRHHACPLHSCSPRRGPTLRGQQHRANAFRQWPPPDQVRVLGKREGEGAQEERRKVTLALLPVLPLSP